MSTRSLTMVIDRKNAENFAEGFALVPQVVSDKSYVNMYLHHDGYPEWRGVQLANWVLANSGSGKSSLVGNFGDGSLIAARLVRDMYYDSCYLYPSVDDIDHQYTYIIWTGKKDDIWISCYDQYSSSCLFVLKPDKVVEKYSHERFKEGYTNYTDWHKLNTNEDG